MLIYILSVQKLIHFTFFLRGYRTSSFSFKQKIQDTRTPKTGSNLDCDPLWDRVTAEFHFLDHFNHALKSVWVPSVLLRSPTAVRHDHPTLAPTQSWPHSEAELSCHRSLVNG